MSMSISQLGDLDFADKRVTILGLGVEGFDLASYLSRHGADVTVSDAKTPEKLGSRVVDVERLGVHLSLGQNDPRAISEADALFVSQGVPLDLPPLVAARERGVPLASMVSLFLELCTGPVVGITGSSGKTTTTALVAEMFRADERPVFVGGNIGIGLLEDISSIRPYTWAVLELSHTQLQLVERSAHVAAVLNITPNHLDRFSWDEYKSLKANAIRFQEPDGTAILNFDDQECRALEPLVKGRLLWTTLGDTLPGDGVLVRDGMASFRLGSGEQPLFALDSLRLRGRHNAANAVAAAAIATACGVSPGAIACAAETFAGSPHRLEHVAEIDGVNYYNDSIATTPERTVAGLRSFEEPIVLVLGGRDKNLPVNDLVSLAAERCREVILFGELAASLEAAFDGLHGRRPKVTRLEALPEAVARASATAQEGDVVLLSPSGTSYDAYETFEQRGDHFRALVQAMIKEAASSLR
jgi:UDP-N-acetylmuramoylalanine--D-glutamate ligase